MIFITYPRTGANFMSRVIYFQTNVNIPIQHGFLDVYSGGAKFDKKVNNSEDIIINIVRDPKDSIISWASMVYDQDEELLIKNGFKKLVKTNYITKYKKLYQELLLLNNVVFIDYEDLSNIKKLLESLYIILNLKAINNDVDINKINEINKTIENYLVSSKNSTKYKEYKETIKDIDLLECYDLYNKALNRCIKI